MAGLSVEPGLSLSLSLARLGMPGAAARVARIGRLTRPARSGRAQPSILFFVALVYVGLVLFVVLNAAVYKLYCTPLHMRMR